MDTPSQTIQKRNIVTYILLSIVTCGIFGLYWQCTLNDDTNKLSGHANDTNGVMVLLLTFLTCGIYSFIWIHKMGNRIDEVKVKRGLPPNNSGTLFLILSVCGLFWLAEYLLQSELNNLAE